MPLSSYPPLQLGRLSAPGPGRTITSVSEPLAKSLREAARVIGASISPTAACSYSQIFNPRCTAEAEQSTVSAEQLGRGFVAMWSVAPLALPSRRCLTLRDAEEWFVGAVGNVRPLWIHIPSDTRATAEALLIGVDPTNLADLLPYVLEHHGPGSRRDVLRDRTHLAAREIKRREGVFYTPSDVADFMIATVLDGQGIGPVLDPACGTGVYLRAACQSLLSRGLRPLDVLSILYGVDTDPIAVDAACFLLASDMGPLLPETPPLVVWHIARLNIAVGDSLSLIEAPRRLRTFSPAPLACLRKEMRAKLLEPGKNLSEPIAIEPDEWTTSQGVLFPEIVDGFTGIVGNPPYAPLGTSRDSAALSRSFDSLSNIPLTPTMNMYVPFMELMWKVTTRPSTSSLVIPLSLAYGSSQVLRGLRRAMWRSGAAWTFHFFDRTPMPCLETTLNSESRSHSVVSTLKAGQLTLDQ